MHASISSLEHLSCGLVRRNSSPVRQRSRVRMNPSIAVRAPWQTQGGDECVGGDWCVCTGACGPDGRLSRSHVEYVPRRAALDHAVDSRDRTTGPQPRSRTGGAGSGPRHGSADDRRDRRWGQRAFGRPGRRPAVYEAIRTNVRCEDLLSLWALDPAFHGVNIPMPSPKTIRLSKRAREHWEMLVRGRWSLS
jgi:hypothetical protein